MKKAVLLDTSAIMYRAFYANMNFKTKSEPTGAVYGFLNTLLKIINDFNPDMIGAAFDVSRKSLKRTESYSQYKSQRDAIPEDLLKQIPRIEELLDCMGIKKFKVEGYEADDVLGTLAAKLSGEEVEVIVVTGDKDLSQIIDDKNIKIALLGKGDKDSFRILGTSEEVKEYLGVIPEKIPDLFGLIGDTSDGIPGVRKIGEKKAVPMLEKYSDLEGIYENIDLLTELPGIGKGIVENLIQDKEIAFLSRELAKIHMNIPELSSENIDLSFEQNDSKLLNLLNILEFKSFIKKLKLEVKEEETEKKLSEIKVVEFHKVDNDETYEKMRINIKKFGKILCFPIETGIAFAVPGNSYYVPLNHQSLLIRNYPLEKIQNIFDLSLPIIGYDLKKIYHSKIEINSQNVESDVLIEAHLVSSTTKDDFPALAHRYLGKDLAEFKDKFGKESVYTADPEELGKFYGEYASALGELYQDLRKDLVEMELLRTEKEIELPLTEVLAAMEKEGIKIDKNYFRKYSTELQETIEDISQKLYEFNSGEIINLNSPKQLSQLLFLTLNLPIIKSTKTGPSTDVEVLEALREKGFEVADLILQHRKYSKLLQTYSEPLPKLADSESRVHTSFNQIGTVTGRLSSSNPNLQNIPAKTDEGMKIRQGFIADFGKKLIGIDYSQIELRVLAELSRDKNLLEAYQNNLDLHTLTAQKIFKLSKDEAVSREQRTVAKIINFSLIYGKTAFGLSKELKISQKDASEYIKAYFDQYPSVKEFEKNMIKFAEENQFVTTHFGRKRLIEGINSKNKNIKSGAERMAVNTVIQGTASEIIKKAMIEIYKNIKNSDEIKMLLQVHDELIFEVKESESEKWLKKLEDIMENSVKFEKVRLSVNGAIGSNWSELK